MTVKDQTINIGGNSYSLNQMSQKAKNLVKLHKFTTKRIIELQKIQKILEHSKKGYSNSIKSEVLSQVAGFDFSQD